MHFIETHAVFYPPILVNACNVICIPIQACRLGDIHGQTPRIHHLRVWNDKAIISLLKSVARDIELIFSCRNLLNLFEWLGPMTSILSQHHEDPYPLEKTVKKPAKTTPLLYTFLHAPPPVLLEFVNCLADDIYTFSRLGLIGQRLGDRAARFSDWCWFTSILVDLVENGVERGVLMDLQRQGMSRLFRSSL